MCSITCEIVFSMLKSFLPLVSYFEILFTLNFEMDVIAILKKILFTFRQKEIDANFISFFYDNVFCDSLF